MSFALLFSGSLGVAISICWPRGVDEFLHCAVRLTVRRAKAILEAPLEPLSEIEIISGISSGLKAGLSLDAAMEALASSTHVSDRARAMTRKVLLQKPGPDYLSRFLCSALESGVPILGSLVHFEKALQVKRRLRLKAHAFTSQCRAQAQVLSLLPWILATGIFIIEPSWIQEASSSSISWVLWAIALALCGIGRAWIHSSIQKATRPKSKQETWEETMAPEFILIIISALAHGKDLETSCEEALCYFEPSFRNAIQAGSAPESKLFRLSAILHNASKNGSPVRAELLGFLEYLQTEIECRWEGRVQQLPVLLLAPLFLCFFPSAVLVLMGLIIPAMAISP